MKSYGTVRRNLPLTSALTRFLIVTFLVFATFNPSYYSLSTWILSGPTLTSVKLFMAFGAGLIWLILIRVSLSGLGWLGIVYVGLAVVIGALLELQFAFLQYFSTYALILMAQLGLAAILTFGLVFSYWIRQISGQSPVVKTSP